MFRALSLALIALALLPACRAAEPETTAGEAAVATVERPAKLGLCVACHGENGRSKLAAAPHIGGQNEVYLIWALNQYKAGKREGDVMNAVVGSLNARDIEQISAWYARQPCMGAAP